MICQVKLFLFNLSNSVLQFPRVRSILTVYRQSVRSSEVQKKMEVSFREH